MVSSAFKLLSPHTVCQVGSVNPDTGHYFACTCDPESGRVIDCQYYKVWVSNIQGDSKTLDSTLDIYIWEWVYQAKYWLTVFERRAN